MSSVGLWRQARDSVAVVCGVGVPSLLAGRGLEVSEGEVVGGTRAVAVDTTYYE